MADSRLIIANRHILAYYGTIGTVCHIVRLLCNNRDSILIMAQ